VNGNIEFVKSEKGTVATAKCTLIPLVSGTLPLPQFRIESTSSVRIRELNSKEDSITVYPPQVVSSLCERIELSDKKKETLILKTNNNTNNNNSKPEEPPKRSSLRI